MAYADPPHPEEAAERPSRRTHRSPSSPQLGSIVMPLNQFALLRTRRFLPLFVTQFLGALNDNFFKNALVILVTYRLAQEAGLNGQILVTAAEIIFMAIAVAGFYSGHVVLLMTVLFLMGVHSTFFGPIKYGILPAHLAPHELLAGNALIEAGTFLAILIGTIMGGVFILTVHGIALVSLGLLAVAGA